MDTLDAINSRRSIRKYLDRPVEFAKITTIMDAAIKAPSAGNIQGWKFILVTEKGLIRQVASHAIEQYWIQTAPILIIICATPEKHEKYYGLRGKRLYNVQECAAAVENILLAATDQGLGSCWIGAFEEEKIRMLFGIPSEVRPQAIVTLGYSDEIAKEKQLLPIEQMVYFNRYNMRIEKLHIVLRDYSVEWQKQKEGLKEKTKKHLSRLREEFHRIKGNITGKFKRKKKE